MSDVPVIPSPRKVQLESVSTLTNNVLLARVRFDDGTELAVEFAPDSDEARELLELLTRLVTATLARLGSRGVVITGFTPPEEDE